MRQTLNTWMTESAKEVLRGDSGERRFRNGENGVFFAFSGWDRKFFLQVSRGFGGGNFQTKSLSTIF